MSSSRGPSSPNPEINKPVADVNSELKDQSSLTTNTTISSTTTTINSLAATPKTKRITKHTNQNLQTPTQKIQTPKHHLYQTPSTKPGGLFSIPKMVIDHTSGILPNRLAQQEEKSAALTQAKEEINARIQAYSELYSMLINTNIFNVQAQNAALTTFIKILTAHRQKQTPKKTRHQITQSKKSFIYRTQ